MGSRSLDEQVRRDLVVPAELEPSSVDVARSTGDRRDVVEARSIWGRPLDEWAIGDGPFVGAGGLVATLTDLAHLVRHAARDGGWLDPMLRPHAWEVEEGVATHTGSLMRSGAVLVLRPDTGTVAVASAVGGTPAFGDRAAMTFLESFVNELEGTST